jgi:hypothetical protein
MTNQNKGTCIIYGQSYDGQAKMRPRRWATKSKPARKEQS